MRKEDISDEAKMLGWSSPAGLAMLDDPNYLYPKHIQVLDDYLVKVATEQNQRLIINLPPRSGKLLPKETTRILMADGSYKLLKDIRVGDKVITAKKRPRAVTDIFEKGYKPTFKIQTYSGKEIVTEGTHPFLTPEGWREAKDLDVGDYMVALDGYETTGQSERSLEEFRLAGYFVGDGSVKYGSAGITCADPIQVEDLKFCAASMGWGCELKEYDSQTSSKYMYSFTKGVRPWLIETDIAGKGSYDKEVPEWVFKGSNEQIGNFLGAYFSCDGTVNKKAADRSDVCVEFYSVSKKLLLGIQSLLQRLGVKARLREKIGKYKDEPHYSWRLSLSTQYDLARFSEVIPIFGCKKDRIEQYKFKKDRIPRLYTTDKIVGIVPTGELDCCCLRIDEDQTYTANDFVTHNSVLVSEYFIPWYLGMNPDKRVIAITYNQGLASDFGRKGRDILTEWGPKLWGVSVDERSAAKDKWEIAGHKGGLLAVGMQGQLTGFGADLMIIDDPVKNAEAADSEIQKEKDWEWFQSTALTRLHPGASLCLIMTRWSYDDLAGRIIDRFGAEFL